MADIERISGTLLVEYPGTFSDWLASNWPGGKDRMATGLSTKRLEEVRPVTKQGQAFDLDKKIALFLLTITLTLFSFMIYGVRNDTAKLMKETTPIHIYHRDYPSSPRELAGDSVTH